MATAAGVTSTELATVFKRRHRVPVGTYVRRRRLDWVADQLLSSDESLSCLAARAGFADQAHLTRAFKATFGRPPARYRRALGNGTRH
ncbi:MAG: helix-turn-helix domain-containing protein [Gemmatimonadales bacterium]